MVVSELWSVFIRILRRNSIYRRNQKLYGTNFKYVVVNVNKRTALRSFRTLKHAREYLLEIQSFYERKNRVVYMNEHSRSIVVSNVAQYIGTEPLLFSKRFSTRFAIYRLDCAVRAFPLERSKKLAKFEEGLRDLPA